MTKGLLFWMIMIILAVFGFLAYHGQSGGPYWMAGMSVVNFVLLAILGWHCFGAAVK